MLNQPISSPMMNKMFGFLPLDELEDPEAFDERVACARSISDSLPMSFGAASAVRNTGLHAGPEHAGASANEGDSGKAAEAVRSPGASAWQLQSAGTRAAMYPRAVPASRTRRTCSPVARIIG